MTKITMSDICVISQEKMVQYYLKISGDEHFMSVMEYTNNVVLPFVIEHGVLEDVEQIQKAG